MPQRPGIDGGDGPCQCVSRGPVRDGLRFRTQGPAGSCSGDQRAAPACPRGRASTLLCRRPAPSPILKVPLPAASSSPSCLPSLFPLQTPRGAPASICLGVAGCRQAARRQNPGQDHSGRHRGAEGGGQRVLKREHWRREAGRQSGMAPRSAATRSLWRPLQGLWFPEPPSSSSCQPLTHFPGPPKDGWTHPATHPAVPCEKGGEDHREHELLGGLIF